MRPLHLISDGGPLRLAGSLISVLAEVIDAAEGSLGWIQLREQVPPLPASDREVLDILEKLLPIAESARVQVLVSRRPDLALAGGAHGVQLGARSIPVSDARRLLGERSLIGYSAHSLSEVEEISRQSVDFLLLSPIFTPTSKSGVRPPLGPQVFAEACRRSLRPVVALGGIGAANLAEVTSIGPVAFIGSVLGAEDPPLAMRQLVTAWRDVHR